MGNTPFGKTPEQIFHMNTERVSWDEDRWEDYYSSTEEERAAQDAADQKAAVNRGIEAFLTAAAKRAQMTILLVQDDAQVARLTCGYKQSPNMKGLKQHLLAWVQYVEAADPHSNFHIVVKTFRRPHEAMLPKEPKAPTPIDG